MSTQHTPGPWWVSAAKDCVWHADHGRICTPPNHAQVWNWEPNARLIAAAPDMYEALKTAPLTLHTFRDPQARCSCSQCQFVRAARAALAKAEGKS